MSNERSDQELLDAWGEGDKTAGDALLARHFDGLYRFFRTKLDGPIDDLIQETLLACVEGRARYRGDAPFHVYMLGIARRMLLRHFRKRYRRGKVFATDELSVCDIGGAPSVSMRGKLVRGQEVDLLLAALRRLPIDLQITLELRYWEEVPLPRIAEVTEVEVGTVKSRLARARQKLEREMAKIADGDEAWARETSSGLETWAAGVRQRIADST